MKRFWNWNWRSCPESLLLSPNLLASKSPVHASKHTSLCWSRSAHKMTKDITTISNQSNQDCWEKKTHIWVAIVARTSTCRTHHNFDIICWRPAHSLDLIVVLDDFNSSGTPLIRSNLDIYDNHIWNIYFMILIGLFGRKTFHRGWNSCRIHHRSCLNPFKDCFYPTGDFANINWYQCWWWY